MSDFDTCVNRRGLVRFEAGATEAAAREMSSASEDLGDVFVMIENRQWKRVTTTAYYAMFHAARALVLLKGYTEKSHYCLGVGFREFYGDTPEGRELAMGLERARVLREDADYRALFDEPGARAAFEMARRFVAFASRRSTPTGPYEGHT